MSDHTTPKTRAVRAGLDTDDAVGAVVPPIHLTSTFAFAGYGDKRAYDYSRSGNPTRDLLGRRARRTRGRGGGGGHRHRHGGGGARDAAAPAGQRAVVPHDCYGGTLPPVQCAARARLAGACEFVDFQDAARARRGARECARTRLGRDAEQSAAAHRGHRSRRGCGPRGRRAGGGRQHLPLARLAASARPRRRHRGALDDQVPQRPQRRGRRRGDRRGPAAARTLAWWANCIGVTGAPFDSYLTLRGLRTLHARMRAHGENAAEVARLPGRAPGGGAGPLPGSRVASGPRPRADASSRDSAPWSASN